MGQGNHTLVSEGDRMSRMLSAANIAAKATQYLRQPHRLPRQLLQPASEIRGASHRRVATAAMASMSAEDRYLFDLNGYVVVPGVLTADEVARCNAAIDANSGNMRERTGAVRVGGNTPLAGDGVTGRQDLAGLLAWDIPGGSPFRDLLSHPRLLPYLHATCGAGYRMDHYPFVLQQRTGAEGFVFHGGATDDDGNWDQALAYGFHHGRMYCPLLAMSVQLTDSKEGEGGFVVVRGSHKANFACPQALKEMRGMTEHAYQPAARAGDVILFTEALTHGTLPWTAERTRRVALYRFSPASVSYGRSYIPSWPKEMLEGMTDAQRAVMEPPYHLRLDRPAPAADGVHAEIPVPRAEFKKKYDASVFGTTYF